MKLNTTLKKNAKLRGDRAIWLIVMALSLISILAVYSSTSALAYRYDTSNATFLIKQSVFVILGLGALFVCYLIPLSIYRKLSIILFGISGLLLIYVAAFGKEINGATRWIDLGPLSFQPSELAKISVVLYLARILEVFKFDTFKDYAYKIMIPIGIMCALCLIGSGSVAVIVGIVAFTILVCAGINWKYLGYTALIGVAACILIYGIHAATGLFKRIDTMQARIERVFIDDVEEMSERDRIEYEEKNFQAKEAREALELGGIWGRGLGNSIKKNSLPHPYSDFIFAIIVEERGLIGGLAVILLYIWFFFRCVIIAQSCKKVFPMLVVLGLATLITLQAMLHIFVNLGTGFVTGQTLPLISLGGSSFLILSAAVGIILSINRTIEIKNDKLRLEQQEQLQEQLEKTEKNG